MNLCVSVFTYISSAFPVTLFLLLVLSLSSLFVCLLSYVTIILYFLTRDRQGVESVEREDGGNFGGVGSGETMTRIYCMEKYFQQKKEKRTHNQKKHTYTHEENDYKIK